MSVQTKTAPLRLEKLNGPGKPLSRQFTGQHAGELVGRLCQPAVRLMASHRNSLQFILIWTARDSPNLMSARQGAERLLPAEKFTE